MSETIEWVENESGRQVFRVTVKGAGETTFTAVVDEVMGWMSDDHLKASDEPSDFEPYLTCLIKWDSCSHFNFGRPTDVAGARDGYLHFCGVQDFQLHAMLIRALYDMAFKHMGRDPQPDEVWVLDGPSVTQ